MKRNDKEESGRWIGKLTQSSVIAWVAQVSYLGKSDDEITTSGQEEAVCSWDRTLNLAEV